MLLSAIETWTSDFARLNSARRMSPASAPMYLHRSSRGASWSIAQNASGALRSTGHTCSRSLSANMSETATPWKFSVEGEQGLEDDERTGTSPRWTGDRGGGEGDTAAVHARVQAEDRAGGGRL